MRKDGVRHDTLLRYRARDDVTSRGSAQAEDSDESSEYDEYDVRREFKPLQRWWCIRVGSTVVESLEIIDLHAFEFYVILRLWAWT